MYLADIINDMRIELQDTAEDVYDEQHLVRAVQKCIGLMPRIIPNRSMVEAVIGGAVTAETLTISSSTGTTTYSPIKPGSFAITGKTLDTHYSINYLTGVVTELGSGLTDGVYTCSYELDNHILDISAILADYIRIDRVEYPVSASVPTYITFDVIGKYLIIRGNKDLALTDNEHLRIIYYCAWTSPDFDTEGDYPSHLNNYIVIGSVGQALMMRSEYFLQQLSTLLSTIQTFITASDPTAPTAPTAPVLTGTTWAAPTASPSAPSALTLTFTELTDALTAVASCITAAEAEITSGHSYINAATKGSEVAQTYAQNAQAEMSGAMASANRASASARKMEITVSDYASRVGLFAQQVQQYAAQVANSAGQCKAENDVDSNVVSLFVAEVQAFSAETQAYQAAVQAYAAGLQAYIGQLAVYMDLAGRYLANGQQKINEFLVAMGAKSELMMSRASADQRE